MRRTLAALALAVVLPLPALFPTAAAAQVVVKPGETLSEIADRHGIALNRLMQANGITNPDLVVAGQRLVIPGSGSKAAGKGPGGRSGAGSVTVQSGETLSDIAARHSVGITPLMQANGITNPDLVVAGQRLVIPGSGSHTASQRASGSTPTPTAPYTVKGGETLSGIADRFGTTTERLIQLNAIANPDLVEAGTRLRIPGRPGAAPAGKAKATGAAPGAAGAKEHRVEPGESLSDIANRYGTTVDRLASLNQIEDPDLVVTGTKLKLHAPPPRTPPDVEKSSVLWSGARQEEIQKPKGRARTRAQPP